METLLFGGEEYKKSLLQEIESVKTSIDISCYILSNDSFGLCILDALKRKSLSGVRVRLIVDGYGSLDWIKSDMHRYLSDHFLVRVYHPLPSLFANSTKGFMHRWHYFFQSLMNLNRRNHQKAFIFDGKRAIVGSRNLNEDGILWRETSIQIADSRSVSQVQETFCDIWNQSQGRIDRSQSVQIQNSKDAIPPSVFTNHRSELRRMRNQFLRNKIQQANSQILLVTPYFFPTLKILNQILKRAEKGVEIKILLPQASDVRISKWISQLQYGLFLRSDVEIFEYEPTILHAKTLIIDDWALIGSSNFNQRSLLRDIELDYCPKSQKTIQLLKEKFFQDLQLAKKVVSEQSLGAIKFLVASIVSRIFPSWF